MDINSYPRRTLLAVTGLSPQVITEILYALAVTPQRPFLPTELQVLTASTVSGSRTPSTGRR
ncbi:MAG: hypothetical protein WCA32_14865 [Chromatiaceae bacterium]|jgi:CRISPR-associated protein (TIGR02584 family)